jgi:hypothetical protein
VLGILIVIRLSLRGRAERTGPREQAIRQLRLHKMLGHLRVGAKEYLRRVPVEQVAEHMRNCAACRSTETCDALFRDRKLVSDMHFCPNYRSLTSLSALFDERRR